ncbi:MAG: hypothetical protein MJZ38_01090 [archaeon]|nr:hypothetical protein [archaeon]
MDNKLILAIAVVAVVVVGGVGAAVMLGNGGEVEVTYHGNGHVTSKGDSTFVISDSMAAPNIFEPQGMEMYNWNTSADGSGTTVNKGEKIPSGVKDLYAQWVAVVDFTHNTTISPQYGHVKISSSTIIQGETVKKTLDGNFGFTYNGTKTKIIFECDTECQPHVNGGCVVFEMDDGSCASYMCETTDVRVVGSQISGRTVEVSLSENVSGSMKFKEDVLNYTIDFKNEASLGFHIEVYCDAYDGPVALRENPSECPALDRSEFEIRIVCDADGSEIFGCQPTGEDKTFSYRIGGVNQPTVHYRVTSSNGGYAYTGSTIGDVSGYANYFLVPIGLAMSYDDVEPNTQFTVEISPTAFSS